MSRFHTFMAFSLFFGLGFTAHFCISTAYAEPVSSPNKVLDVDMSKPQNMKKVTGIGGIFFKSEDPTKLKEWYQTHLGLNTDAYGTNFEWRQGADTAKKGFTQWSPFQEKTTYFQPSAKDFMINYRVHDLEALVKQLKEEGVTLTDEIATYEYGKFVHILDGEGNKVELWEPNDAEYDKLVEGRTK